MTEELLLNQPVGNYMAITQLNEFMSGHRGYIAGGVFKNIFKNEKIKDVDVFFEAREDFLEAVDYYKKNEDYSVGYKNDRVESFTHKPSGIVIELIKHKFKKPLSMIKEFDFTISKFVYYKLYKEDEDGEETVEWKIAFHNRFFEHLMMNRLVIDQPFEEIIFPISSYNRMFKYGQYGYFPCRETKVKVIEALRNLDEFDEEALALGLYFGMD